MWNDSLFTSSESTVELKVEVAALFQFSYALISRIHTENKENFEILTSTERYFTYVDKIAERISNFGNSPG